MKHKKEEEKRLMACDAILLCLSNDKGRGGKREKKNVIKKWKEKGKKGGSCPDTSDKVETHTHTVTQSKPLIYMVRKRRRKISVHLY